jgi:ribosomal protein L14
MKLWLVPLALLVATPVFAQSAAPMVGDRPLVVVKPKAAATAPAKSGKPQSIAVRLQACLEIEDGSKGRLDCYDAVIKPKPKTNPRGVKSVNDCGSINDEESRLSCFNGFAEKLPKPR